MYRVGVLWSRAAAVGEKARDGLASHQAPAPFSVKVMPVQLRIKEEEMTNAYCTVRVIEA